MQTDRALGSLPWPLVIEPSTIPGAGQGVKTRANLPCCLVFGPYLGTLTVKSVNTEESGYGWQIRALDHKPMCVDAVDTTISNWMRYVNCPRNENEVNLAAFQYRGLIYYRTIKPIER